MSEITDEALPWWVKWLDKIPGFVYGFFVGVVSGYFANWAWERFRPRRREPHLNIEVGKHGTYFTGLFPPEQQSKFIKVLEAAAKTTPRKKKQSTPYIPPSGSDSTRK